MRAVGYTLDTAIADLIDNSITAGSEVVQIFFNAQTADHLAILDNGDGMDEDTIKEAMRLAGRSARSERGRSDLGRFGLGLKTASLSQCRDLTVVSKANGTTTALRWSLDHLAETGRWALISLSNDEIAELPRARDLDSLESGTLVLWRQLDQMSGITGHSTRTLEDSLVQVRDHLSLVFHRFLAGEHGRKFSIEINRVPLRQLDPFLTDHRATQVGPRESFKVENQIIELRSYTLPFLNKMKQQDRERAQVSGSLRDSQGFYIYRAMRLVIWGTWFRIVPKEELGKLARVRVDIPNTLDHLWALDIKKSAAVPPPAIRAELRRVVDRIVEPSRAVHRYRGRIAPGEDAITRGWNLVQDRDHFRYEINRTHPIIEAACEQLNPAQLEAFGRVLAFLELSFPVEDAHNRLAGDQVHETARTDEESLVDLAQSFWDIRRLENPSVDDFVGMFSSIEPFSSAKNASELLRKVAAG